MKVYISDSDETVEVKSYTELVDYMRMSAKSYYKDNNEFMKAFSIRAVQWLNVDVRSTNENDFVKDLIAEKMIKCD